MIYSDAGISNILLSKENPSKEFISTLFIGNIFFGFLVTLVLLALNPLIVSFYHEESLRMPLFLISFVFLIIPLGQQFQVLFQKNLQFNVLSKIEISSNFIGFILSLSLAVIHPNVLALVFGQITIYTMKAGLLFFIGSKKWRHGLYFSFNEFKQSFSFGAFQMGEKTVHFFSTNLDKMIIGKLFGTEVLGLYNLAYQIIILPVLKINPVITNIAVSLFSRVSNNKEKLKKGYLSILGYISFINFPIYFGLALVSPLIVPLFLGEKWSESIELIQVLSIMGAIRSLISPNTTLTVSHGRADIGFTWTIVTMIILIPSITVGAFIGGAVAISWALVISQVILFFINYGLIIKRFISLTLYEYIRVFFKPLMISFVMFLIGYGLLEYTLPINYFGLFFLMSTCILFYFVFNSILNKEVFMDFYSLVKKNKRIKLNT